MNSSAIAPQPAFNDAQQSLRGLAALMTMAFQGADLMPLGRTLIERIGSSPDASTADALMDLAVILHISGNSEVARGMQEQALQFKQLYQLPARDQPAIRLLAIYAPGAPAANTPLEFLTADSDIELNMLYLAPELTLKDEVPEHDVLFVAIGESEQNLATLKFLEPLVEAWPRPVLNYPDKIARQARDTVSQLLHSTPGVVIPGSFRVRRESLERVARGEQHIREIQDGNDFPVIIRPIDSHAGIGLIKADDAASVAKYLETMPQQEFFVAQFVNYSSSDGRYRKYRVVLMAGQPYASHMAISDHWMVHYLNGGMTESAEKRAEEERFMSTFDQNFAVRHQVALQGISERMNLDYFAIDCAETPDGQLLVFEADSCAVVHAMDPVDMFPYKQTQMQKVFTAFRAMLIKTIERGTKPFAAE